MSDDKDRLSAARRVEGLQQKPNAMDGQAPARGNFDRARDPLIGKQLDDMAQDQQRRQSQAQPQGSRQVAESGPAMRPTPPPGTAEIDREAHNARRAQDDAAARDKLRSRFGTSQNQPSGQSTQSDSARLSEQRQRFGDAATNPGEPGQAQRQRTGQGQR